MNLLVLVSSILTSGIIIVMSFLLYKRIRELNTKHLIRVSMGLFMQAMLPFSFIPQGLVKGDKYSTFLSVIAIIGATTFLIGLLIFTWNLKIHQNVDVPKRYLGLIFITGFAVASIFNSTKVVWDGTYWIIERDIYSKILMFSGILWIIIEDIHLFITGIKHATSKWDKLSIFYLIGLILSFIMLILREELGFPTTAYHIPTAIGGSLFAIALIKSPKSMILPKIKISNIILVHRKSGVGLINYPDVDFTQDAKMFLTANALSGIVELIKEIAGKTTLPPRIGYADYSIGIYPGVNIFIYSISNGFHPLLEGLLLRLAKIMDGLFEIYTGLLDAKTESKFINTIKEELSIFL